VRLQARAAGHARRRDTTADAARHAGTGRTYFNRPAIADRDCFDHAASGTDAAPTAAKHWWTVRYEPAPEPEIPPPLSPPASIQARNTEYNLDLIGRVTHLDEKCMVASFPVEIPEGTVLFTNVDLRSINAMVRGLVRIRSQAEGVDIGGYSTIAEFVDLNEDEKRKIRRQLSGEAGTLRGQAGADAVESTEVRIAPASTLETKPRRRFRWPVLRLPTITIASVIWVLLGIVFYSIVALAIVAIFPQGRAWELMWFGKLWHSVGPAFRSLFK
jgi:hypothetical protein